MINLWYLNVTSTNEKTFGTFLMQLPQGMRNEIMRFRNFEDRCLKLYGKLMVKKYHLEHNNLFNWSDWRQSEGGKPSYNKGKSFNISHSGDYVTVAFSNTEIGVDIEKMTEVDIASISEFLHPKEKQFILQANDKKEAFYTIWTRKEAYLKARGVGIVKGLNRENCLEPIKTTGKEWFLTSVNFLPEYKLALCSESPDYEIQKQELKPTDFL